MSEDVRRWDERVTGFIEENRPLLENPDLGTEATRALLKETTELLTPLADAEAAKVNEAVDATNQLAKVINASHSRAVFASKMRSDSLKTDHEQLRAIHTRLQAFRDEVQEAMEEA